jgi:hypothetical protein
MVRFAATFHTSNHPRLLAFPVDNTGQPFLALPASNRKSKLWEMNRSQIGKMVRSFPFNIHSQRDGIRQIQPTMRNTSQVSSSTVTKACDGTKRDIIR